MVGVTVAGVQRGGGQQSGREGGGGVVARATRSSHGGGRRRWCWQSWGLGVRRQGSGMHGVLDGDSNGGDGSVWARKTDG